jgi:hypothetical protein
MDLQGVRIGYVPYSNALTMPGDRRRFVNFARKCGLPIEIADPSESYDLVVLTERADISVWSDYAKGKIAYDLIDSYLAIPRTSVRGRLRGLAKFISRQSHYLQQDHWTAVERMCRRADAVICTTLEQKQDISPFCDNVHLILDSHSMMAHATKQDYQAAQPFRIAWEGLPYTLSSLNLVADVLKRVNQQRPIELHVITDRAYYGYLGKYHRRDTQKEVEAIYPGARVHEWREETCAALICDCDLAVIPLDLEDPFQAGKPENKMLLFWRMGMPVVASATPAYARAALRAGMDMLCATPAEWEAMLLSCIDSEEKRFFAGHRGRSYVEACCNEDTILGAWERMMSSLWEEVPVKKYPEKRMASVASVG